MDEHQYCVFPTRNVMNTWIIVTYYELLLFAALLLILFMPVEVDRVDRSHFINNIYSQPNFEPISVFDKINSKNEGAEI